MHYAEKTAGDAGDQHSFNSHPTNAFDRECFFEKEASYSRMSLLWLIVLSSENFKADDRVTKIHCDPVPPFNREEKKK